jgi:hypothetical protein
VQGALFAALSSQGLSFSTCKVKELYYSYFLRFPCRITFFIYPINLPHGEHCLTGDQASGPIPKPIPRFTHPLWKSESQRLGISQERGCCKGAPSLASPAGLSLRLPWLATKAKDGSASWVPESLIIDQSFSVVDSLYAWDFSSPSLPLFLSLCF